MSKDLQIFKTFCKPCNRIFAEPAANWLSLVISNFDRYNMQAILLLYVCQISDPIFDVRFLNCQFYPSKCDIQGLPIFGSFCKLLKNVVTEIPAKPSKNWEVSSNRILTATVGRPSCSSMCAKLVIQYLMCGFRLVSSTRQNVISRGLPVFGSFCKLLRNVVTETFAEPSENLGSLVKSNFDRWTIPFLYKCQISDSLFDVRFPTCQFYLLKCEVRRAPNFQKVLQTSEEFCD